MVVLASQRISYGIFFWFDGKFVLDRLEQGFGGTPLYRRGIHIAGVPGFIALEIVRQISEGIVRSLSIIRPGFRFDFRFRIRLRLERCFGENDIKRFIGLYPVQLVDGRGKRHVELAHQLRLQIEFTRIGSSLGRHRLAGWPFITDDPGKLCQRIIDFGIRIRGPGVVIELISHASLTYSRTLYCQSNVGKRCRSAHFFGCVGSCNGET